MLQFLFQQTPLVFFVQSFWRDEAFSYLLAQHSVWDIITLTAKDFNPPLYYLLLHGWIRLFGSSEIALRSLSFIFFMATAYVVFDIFTEVCRISWRRSLLYLVLVFLNPILHYYAFETRMYSMIAFLATLSFYALMTKKKRLYFISLLLGLYTHYFMIFVLFVQVGYLLILHHQSNRRKLILLCKPMIIAFVCWLPWMLFVLTQRTSSGDFWISKPTVKEVIYLPAILYTGYEKEFRFSPFLTYITLTIGVILIASLVYMSFNRRLQKNKNLLLLLSLWTFAPPLVVLIMSFVFTPTFLPRYLLFSSVGLIILIVFLLETLPMKVRSILFILLFILTLRYLPLNRDYRHKRDVRKNFNEVKLHLRSGDKVYVKNIFDFHTAQYYFDPDIVYIYQRPYEEIPTYVGKILIPPEKVVFTPPPFPTKAYLVTETTFEPLTQL